MSYVYQGGTWDDVVTMVTGAKTAYDTAREKLQPVVSAATTILEDPALPEVTRLVLRLREIEKRGSTSTQPKPGIGLDKVVRPLRMYVKYRENPWLGYAAIGLILGIPFLIGRRSARR